MVLFLKYLRATNEMYLALHLKKWSLANFAQANSIFVWMDVRPGRSSGVTQCVCWYVTIDKNGNSGAHKTFLAGSCFGRSGSISTKIIYSSHGSISALVLGGKPSFCERCHCCCILYSKNLHFHCCLKIQHIPWSSPRYSGLWYRA